MEKFVIWDTIKYTAKKRADTFKTKPAIKVIWGIPYMENVTWSELLEELKSKQIYGNTNVEKENLIELSGEEARLNHGEPWTSNWLTYQMK